MYSYSERGFAIAARCIGYIDDVTTHMEKQGSAEFSNQAPVFMCTP